MSSALHPESRQLRGQAALTAVSSVAVMALGAVVAVLVLLLFGAGARTDGLFAAYAVYAILVASGQGLRVALVGRLLPEEGWRQLSQLTSAAGIAVVLAGIPMVALAGPLSRLLVGDLGAEALQTAEPSLRLLWLAGSLHVFTGLFAAALAARGDVRTTAAGQVVGATVAIAALLALSQRLELLAVPVALLVGAAVACGWLASGLARRGWRGGTARTSTRELVQLLAGSFTSVMMQLTYLVSLACAARLGPGAVTAYSYAFFAALLVLGATAGPASIVLVRPLAQSWDRRAAALEPRLVAVAQLGFVLLVPPLAAALVLGERVLEELLASSSDVVIAGDVVRTLVALSGFIAAAAAAAVPTAACFAAGRFAVPALVSAAAVGLHVPLSLVALQLGSPAWLALAASCTSVVLTTALVVVVQRGQAVRALRLLAAEAVRVLLLAAVTFGPVVLLARRDPSILLSVGALLAALVGFVLLVRLAAPGAFAFLRGMTASPARVGST